MGFTVNGKAADLEKLKEAGYTVSYEYDKTALASYTDGKIDATKVNGTSFEYRVVVTPKEGEAVTSEWTEVTIQDATKVTKVNKVALVKGSSEWTQSVLDGQVAFKATEFENALGEKNTDKDVSLDAPDVESAKSSDATIAYYDGTTIKVLKDGEVTFDVKFEGVTETVPVTVKVVAEQSMKSIKVDAQKVAANDATAKAKFIVLDQNKEAFVGDDTNTKVSVEIKKGTETAVAAKDATVNSKGEVTVDAKNLAKGSYTVVVSTKDVTPVKLGEFSIEAVDIQGNPDAYALSLPTEETKPEIDIKNNTATLVLDAKGTIQGIDADLPNTADFKVIAKSSDTKVATAELDTATKKVTVTPAAEAKAGDTVKVQLYTKQGSKEVAVGNEITITIVNTTPQVKTMTLKKDTKVTFTNGDDDSTLVSKVIAAIVEGEEGSENQVKADMIDSVTYVASNEEVLVKVKTLNGGQTFKLAAIELGNKADLNQSITDAEGSAVKEVEAVAKAITEAKKVQADTTATQKQVDAATKTLKEAKAETEAATAAVKAGTATAADYKTLTGLTVNDVEVATLNAYLKTATVEFYEKTNADDSAYTPAKQSIADAVAGVKAATSLTPVKGDSFTANGTTLTKYTLPNLEIKTTTLAALISTKGTNPTSVLLIDDNGDLHVTNDGTKRVLYALKKDKSGQGAVATTWVKFEITPAQ